MAGKKLPATFRGVRLGSTGKLISGENTIAVDASALSKPTRFDSNGNASQDSNLRKKRDASSSLEKVGDDVFNSIPSTSNFMMPSEAQLPPSVRRETPF